jgi:hypothetical protein
VSIDNGAHAAGVDSVVVQLHARRRMMNINDLIIDDPDEDPLCLVLNLSGPHMASKLEIACDGSFPE